MVLVAYCRPKVGRALLCYLLCAVCLCLLAARLLVVLLHVGPLCLHLHHHCLLDLERRRILCASGWWLFHPFDSPSPLPYPPVSVSCSLCHCAQVEVFSKGYGKLRNKRGSTNVSFIAR